MMNYLYEELFKEIRANSHYLKSTAFRLYRKRRRKLKSMLVSKKDNYFLLIKLRRKP